MPKEMVIVREIIFLRDWIYLKKKKKTVTVKVE